MKTKHAITKYLEEHGKTFTQLARDAGLNHSVLSRILSGVTKNLTVDTAERIADATDNKLTVHEILGLQPIYIIREVYVQSGTGNEEDSSRNKEDAPGKDSTYPTPSFGSTVGTTSLSPSLSPDQSSQNGVLGKIFDLWVEMFGKDPRRTLLTLKRKKAVIDAVRKHEPHILVDSLRGHANNPWRHGVANRNELATLLREDNVQRGLDDLEKFGMKPEEQPEEDFWRQQAEQERKLH